MIDIIVNKQKLVIDEITIDFDLVSPITRNAQGSTVFNFDVPDDDEKINARALNYPHRPYRYQDDNTLETRIEKKGLTLLEGEATASFSDGRFTISLPVGNGLFYSKAKEKSIRELPICNKTFPTIAHLVSDLNTASQQSWPDAQYSAVPVESRNLLPEDVEGTIYFSGVTIDEGEVLEEGDEISSNGLAFPYFASAEVVSYTYNSGSDTGHVVVKACRNTFMEDETLSGPKGFSATITSVNGWFANNFFINKYENGSFVPSYGGNDAFLTPFFYVAEIVKNIFEYFGYSIDNRFFNRHAEWKSLLLFNNWNAAGGVEGHQNWPLIGINSSNHLPDYTITDFLSNLENYRNIFCFISESRKEVTIIDLNEMMDDTEVNQLNFTSKLIELEPESFEGFHFKMNLDDNRATHTDANDERLLDKVKPTVNVLSALPAFPSYDEIRYVIDEDTWYRYAFNPESGVVEWFSLPQGAGLTYNYFILDGKETRETDFAPPGFGEDEPRIDIPASSWDELKLTVFFQITSNPPKGGPTLGDSYLFASDKVKGISAKVLQPESKWMQQRRQIQFTATLSHKELNNLQLWKKYQVDGMVFIVTKLEGQIQPEGNVKAKITGWTI